MNDGAQASLEFAVPWVFYPADQVPIPFAADSYGRLTPHPPLFDAYSPVVTTGIGRLSPLPPYFSGAGVTRIEAEGTFAPPRIAFSGNASVYMQLCADPVRAGWQPAGNVMRNNDGIWQHGAPQGGIQTAGWQPATPRESANATPWQHSAPIEGDHHAGWRIVGPRQGEKGDTWQHGPRAHSLYICVWAGPSSGLSAGYAAHFEYVPIHQTGYLDAWAHGAIRSTDFFRTWQPARKSKAGHRAKWEFGRLSMQWPRIIIIPPLPIPGRPLDDGSRIAIPFLGGWVFIPGDQVRIPFGLDIEPPHPGTIIVITPVFSAVRLSDRLPFRLVSLSMDLSQDKSSWEARFNLDKDDDYNLISAPETEVEIMLQGYTWRLVVVSIQQSRVFGQVMHQVTARSPSVYLGPNWAPTYTDLETITRTAQQLAAARLPFPWLLDWQTVDWLVPGGQFSYQNLTPAEIVKRIAETVGATVQPDMILDTLHIRPKHPAASWLWANMQNLYTLPASLLLSSYFNPSDRNRPANAVYLAGTQTNGSRARVKRFGTGGDVLYTAEPSSPLLTHADAFREAGLQLLSASGRVGTQSITTFLMPPGQHPRLLQIGEVIEVGDTREVFRGLVSQIKIDFKFGNLPLQTIELERY